MSASGCPADQRWCGASDGANQRTCRRDPFERRIQEQVAEERECGQQTRKGIRRNRKERDTKNREPNSEPQRVRASNSARNEWPQRGAAHSRVVRQLDLLIQRRRSASDE